MLPNINNNGYNVISFHLFNIKVNSMAFAVK